MSQSPATSPPGARATDRIGPIVSGPTTTRSSGSVLRLNTQQRREKHAEEYWRTHTDPSGQARPDLWLSGVNHVHRMKVAVARNPAAGQFVPAAGNPVFGVQWTQIGPAPLRIDQEQNFQGAGPDSGEVVDIAIDPRNATDRVIYIATNDGGIWKSTDGGLTWKPKTDSMPSLSMGSVALDPGNPSIVYAGTGNLFDGGSIFFKGVGIYRSNDGGDTWSVLGGAVFNNLGINRMVLPAANVLLVGCGTFNRCGNGSGSGLYRSIDGGANFGANAPQFDDGNPILTGCISDLDLDPTNPMIVYASVRGQGIFVSTDAGATFPNNLFSNPGAPGGTYGIISFSQSTLPNNQTMYASIAGAPYAGLFKSTDGGANWMAMADAANRAAENNGCQCSYDLTVGVDPQNANRVYIGFQELYLSTDGGVNFGTPAVSRNKIHWDHHALAFSPRSHWGASTTTRIYCGTDGGIHASSDAGANWDNLNEGIATSLLVSLDIGRGSAANRVYTYGGTWDTGTVEHRPGFAGNDWHLARDGDGGRVVVDPNNPMRCYGQDNGIFMITTDGGDNWPFSTSAATGLPDCGGSNAGRACAVPMAIDPNNTAIIYAVSGAQLFQSTDSGATFTSINTFPSSVTFVAVEAIDSNTVWVGLANGRVQRTGNALAGAASTWTSSTVTGAPITQGVSALAIDPGDTAQVVVVYAGFSDIDPSNRTKHVFRTTDNGATWTDISGTDGGDPTQNLPDLPLHSVVIDNGTSPHTIIVSSDAGVMRTANWGATWEVLGLGLPTVDCKALAIDRSASPALLRVGTYGRSAFELTPATGPLLAVNVDLTFGNVCVNECTTRILQLFNVGSADLHIANIARISGRTDFQLISGPATPVAIRPGEELDYTIRFCPRTPGEQTAVFQLNSDDPFQPAHQLVASGSGGAAQIATVIADAGKFGDVCVGSFRDLLLIINNPSGCNLVISNITSTSDQFEATNVMFFPLVVQAGTSLKVPIRFEPTNCGSATMGMIVIESNATNAPLKMVNVSGNVPCGDIRVTGSTDFGDACPGERAEQTLSICNVGLCDLRVSSVSFVPPCPDFVLINNPFPTTVSHDFCIDVVIRFTPTSCGSKTCNLRIESDDPDAPVINLTVMATAPCAEVDVSPDLAFAPEVIQSDGACTTELPFPISNKGRCNLTITSITLGGPNAADFSLSGLPSFPIILEPGHIAGEGDLNVVFAPKELDRDREATITVSYVSDPTSGATMSVTRKLCGEGVHTGARVLVTHGGLPIPILEKIHLQRINANRNRVRLDTQDQAMRLPLVTVTPAVPCQPFQYHREYGTIANPVQLLPGSYQITVTAIVNGKRQSKTVGFNVDTCDFNANIVVDF